MGPSECSAMWILSAGPDYAGCVVAFVKAQAVRRRHRLRDVRQHLPLRHLPAHPLRDQRSGQGDGMIDLEKPARETITVENVSRRRFLQGMLATSAFVLCSRKAPLLAKAARNGAPSFGVPSFGAQSLATSAGGSVESSAFHPSVFLGIHTDGTVYIVAHRSEMGNGVRTSLPRILADELDADWSRVTVLQADGDAAYGSQDTDGSHSVREFFDVLREAGATARLMLVRAAAQQWGIPESQCVADPVHVVSDKGSSRKLGYGELAVLAAKLPVPKTEELQFKSPQQWCYIGKP